MAIIKVKGTFEYHYDTEEGLVANEAEALADVEEYILFNGVNANDLDLVVETVEA